MDGDRAAARPGSRQSDGTQLARQAATIHERNNDRWGLTQTIGPLGALARDADDQDRAYELIAQSVALAREVAVPWWESGMLAELAQLALNAGRVGEGRVARRESLVLADQMRDRGGRVFGVGLLARVAAERGQPDRAGRLWGSIEGEDAGAPLGGWRATVRRAKRGFAKPPVRGFERGRAEGRELTLDDAVSLAMALADTVVSPRRSTAAPKASASVPVGDRKLVGREQRDDLRARRRDDDLLLDARRGDAVGGRAVRLDREHHAGLPAPSGRRRSSAG